MFRPERFLIDGSRPLIELFGLRIVALAPIEDGQAIDGDSGIGMIGA
jgi:hypothetical protein